MVGKLSSLGSGWVSSASIFLQYTSYLISLKLPFPYGTSRRLHFYLCLQNCKLTKAWAYHCLCTVRSSVHSNLRPFIEQNDKTTQVTDPQWSTFHSSLPHLSKHIRHYFSFYLPGFELLLANYLKESLEVQAQRILGSRELWQRTRAEKPWKGKDFKFYLNNFNI